jgi:predicted small metal-binding protein
MKILHCADAGFNCQAVIHAETEEEVLTQAAEHAVSVHGATVTPAMVDQIKTLIKNN